MAQIGSYSTDSAPSLNDRVIGTESVTGLAKNYQLGDIVSLVNGVAGKDYIQYKFSLTDYVNIGSFTTNASKTNPTEITKLFLNKESTTKEDLSVLYNKLDTLQNIAISLRNPANTNNFATFKVTNITTQTTYFEFDVVLYKNFSSGSLIAGTTYSAYFDVKENFEDKLGQGNYVGTAETLKTDIETRVVKVTAKSLVADAEITKLSHLNDTTDLLKPLSTAAINALALKLMAGGYAGTAEDLRLLIISSTTGVSGISATPAGTPTGTGVASWVALEPGTYTNYGGVVVNINSIAVISRSATNVYSVTQTVFDITSKVNVSEVKVLSPDGVDFILDEAWVNTGESAAYAGMVRTEPFVVAGGEPYIYRGYGIASTINVLELDFDGNPIVFNNQEFGTNDGNSHDVEITLNKNTRFVALTFLKSVFNAHGCSFLSNEKTSLTIANLQNELSTLSSDNSALKINLLGDSIGLYGTLAGGWIKQLYTSLGISISTLNNYAIGGNRLSIPFGGNDATIAGGGATAMCVRYTAMSDDADIILIEGGANDGLSRVGTLAELTALTPDKTTITGAMRVLIEGVFAKYAGKKNIRLIWIINPRSFSYSNAIDHTGVVELDTTPREDVMKSVLKYYGIPYVDLYNESGISRLTARPNPNIVYGITWVNSSSSLTGSGTFDTVAGYEASDYIAAVYGDVFCSDNWCKVAFYNSSFVHIAGSTQFNDAHATVNYTAPVGTAYFRVSKPNSTVLYLTNAKGTYMCDPVHPTLNAQEIIFRMVQAKIASVKKL